MKKEKTNVKRLKKDIKGITLIALVVTIIVLLILAGIALNLTIGENGLFTRAQNAANTWQLAEQNEQNAMNDLASWIDSVTGGNSGNNQTGETAVEAFKAGKIKVGDYITNFNDSIINKSASVTLSEEETGHAGDQTYTVDMETTWRVLGLSADGTQLVLTTGSPIKKVMNPEGAEDWEKDPYLYLEGAEGWYNTNDALTDDNILDRICKIYDNSLAEEVKSMRIEDINTQLGITVGEDGQIYKDGTRLEMSQSFIGQSQNYGEESNNYAPENYLKEVYPDNEKYQSLDTKYVGDEIDGSAYMYMVTDPSVIEQESKLYEVLFKDTASNGYPKSYWLASSGVFIDGSICGFGPGYVNQGMACDGGSCLFDSFGCEGEFWFGVRPVVYLKSNIPADKLKVNEAGTEETWNTTIPNSFEGKNINKGQVSRRDN